MGGGPQRPRARGSPPAALARRPHGSLLPALVVTSADHSFRACSFLSTTYLLPQNLRNSAVPGRRRGDAVLLPPPVHRVTNVLRHLDALRPLARALLRQLVGRVDAELTAVAGQHGGVVELVERALAEEDVPLRVDVGADV